MQRAEVVAGELGGPPDPPARSPRRGRARAAEPDEAELLADRGEDEVGLLLGHEAELGLGALEEALARHPPVAMACLLWSTL